MSESVEATDAEEFSLVLLRSRWARPPLDLVNRRVAAITLVAWLPLVLTVIPLDELVKRLLGAIL